MKIRISNRIEADEFLLTIANHRTIRIINNFLIPTHIPISEENYKLPYEVRKKWKVFADSTKLYINVSVTAGMINIVHRF